MPFKTYALSTNSIQNVRAFNQYHSKRTRFQLIPFKTYPLSINAIHNVCVFGQCHSKRTRFQLVPFKTYPLSVNTIQSVSAFNECLWKRTPHLTYMTESAYCFQYVLSRTSGFQSFALNMHTMLNINEWHCSTFSLQAVKNDPLNHPLFLQVNRTISFDSLSHTAPTMQSGRFNKREY